MELDIDLSLLNVEKVDAVFALSFLIVLVGGFLMFLSSTIWVVVASMVGMFLGFVSMILCLGLEFD